MLSFNTTPCKTFNTANILRTILTGEGYPAIAATFDFIGKEMHYCLSVCPGGVASAMNIIANLYATQPDGLEFAEKTVAEINEMPGHAEAARALFSDEERTELGKVLREALAITPTVVVKRVLPEDSFASNGIVTLGAPNPNHDPGDEDDTKPVQRRQPNPLGGGWDGRCVDENGNVTTRDQYDSWKAAR